MSELVDEIDMESTSEINFKYASSKKELDLLKKEYFALQTSYSTLESRCAAYHSQIESLKLAFQYSSTYEINKESDYKHRIQQLEQSLRLFREEKENLSFKYSNQINVKEVYIESLLTKMLNMHQRIEYFKDDLSELKRNYESQSKTLNSEMKMREETELLYEKSLKELEEFKKSLSSMKTEYTETMMNSEQLVNDIRMNYEHEHQSELASLIRSHEAQLKVTIDNYNLKLISQEKSQKELMESMTKYMNIRLDDLKHHYELRISNMIRNFSFEEARFESRVFNLSNILENLHNKYNLIEGELLGKTSCINLINEERKELKTQKIELDKYIEQMELTNKTALFNTYAELEETKIQLKRSQNELQLDYEKKLKMMQNKKAISVEGIRLRYQKKLDKLKMNSEEDTQKLKKFHEAQCEYLLEELSRLETLKTELEIKVEFEIRQFKDEADAKIEDLERKLKYSREAILREYNKERGQIINEYKLQLHEQNKNLVAERNKAVAETEKTYKEIIGKMKEEFNKEKTEMFQDNLKKMAEVQELCKKKVLFIENKLDAVKQNHANDLELFNSTVKSKEAEIRSMNSQIYELSNEIDSLTRQNSMLDNEKHALIKEHQENFDKQNKISNKRELDLYKRFEEDKRNALNKVYAEKADIECKLEKTIHTWGDRYDSLLLKYKLLESKKKDMFLKENQQTVQRLVFEMNDKNKTIDGLNKEIGKLKMQVKYVGDTMKIFTNDKISSVSHRKSGSESNGAVHKQRPSSVGMNKTFKF